MFDKNMNGSASWENPVSMRFQNLPKGGKNGFQSFWLEREGTSLRIWAVSEKSNCREAPRCPLSPMRVQWLKSTLTSSGNGCRGRKLSNKPSAVPSLLDSRLFACGCRGFCRILQTSCTCSICKSVCLACLIC